MVLALTLCAGSAGPAFASADEVNLLRHYQPEYHERYVNYKNAHPELAYFDVVTYVNIGLDFPYYADEIVKNVTNPDSVYVLCNKYNRLPEDYVPPEYQNAGGRALFLRNEAQAQFDIMRADAAKSGINIYIVSGYRSYAVQDQIYRNYKQRDPNGADKYSARPGHSEHQTGLAADLNTASSSAHFEATKEFAWLLGNAHNYGFILRYPEGKEWLTGYMFEPWHWRYVGAKAAAEIKKSDITFDEYCAIYLVPQNIKNVFDGVFGLRVLPLPVLFRPGEKESSNHKADHSQQRDSSEIYYRVEHHHVAVFRRSRIKHRPRQVDAISHGHQPA